MLTSKFSELQNIVAKLLQKLLLSAQVTGIVFTFFAQHCHIPMSSYYDHALKVISQIANHACAVHSEGHTEINQHET